MAVIDDMLTDRAPLDFKHRNQEYRIYYRPLAIDDAVKIKLDEMVAKFDQKATGDFSGVNPLLLEVLADWEFDRIKRDAEGRPLAHDGTVLVDRNTQAPALERLPITEDTIARLAVFLKLDMFTAIVRDINGAAGNTNGTSDTTQQAGNSAGGADVPGSNVVPISGPSTSPGSNGTTVPPALVSVPSLESQRNIT